MSLTINFQDTSTDDGSIVAWLWEFGDGDTSTLKNPTHTYAAPGQYVVIERVTDNHGNVGVSSQLVVVEGAITDLVAAIAAKAGKVLALNPASYVLNGDVTGKTTHVALEHGSVITLAVDRTLASLIDASRGGRFLPASGKRLSLTGRLNVPPNFHVFDISAGGSFFIACQAIDRLTPYNFGALGDDEDDTDDGPILRAWYAACVSDALTASGGILPYLAPSHGFRIASFDAGVGLRVTKDLVPIHGPSEGMGRIHIAPDGSNPAGYTGILFEDPTGPLQFGGLRGVAVSGGGNTTDIKIGVAFHDVRHILIERLDLPNISDVRYRCIGLLCMGRDNIAVHGVHANIGGIPIVIDDNFDETNDPPVYTYPLSHSDGNPWAGSANGYRDDNKGLDHAEMSDLDLGVVDNPKKAAILIRPGVPIRNVLLGPYLALVGGGIVWRDHEDGPDQDIEAAFDTTNNIVQITDHGRTSGDQVMVETAGSLTDTGLAVLTWYWLYVYDADHVGFATNFNKAVSGDPADLVDLTGSGSGVHTVTGSPFAGALREPRRKSTQVAIRDGRVEGIVDGGNAYAIDIWKHPNAELESVKVENFNLGSGSDDRYNDNITGSQAAAPWNGGRFRGVRRVTLINCSYGGAGIPLDVDDDCELTMIGCRLVPEDAGRVIPIHPSQYEFLGLVPPAYAWIMDQTTQDSTIREVLHGAALKLSPTGATKPTYNQFVEGYHGRQLRFNASVNQKMYILGSDAAGLDPATHKLGISGEFTIDNGWVPDTGLVSGKADLLNLGGDNQGPLLRFDPAGSGKFKIRANTTESALGAIAWNDGVPFKAFLWIDHAALGAGHADEIKALIVKKTGEWELITGTHTTTLNNTVFKCAGGYSTANASFAGLMRELALHVDDLPTDVAAYLAALKWSQDP